MVKNKKFDDLLEKAKEAEPKEAFELLDKYLKKGGNPLKAKEVFFSKLLILGPEELEKVNFDYTKLGMETKDVISVYFGEKARRLASEINRICSQIDRDSAAELFLGFLKLEKYGAKLSEEAGKYGLEGAFRIHPETYRMLAERALEEYGKFSVLDPEDLSLNPVYRRMRVWQDIAFMLSFGLNPIKRKKLKKINQEIREKLKEVEERQDELYSRCERRIRKLGVRQAEYDMLRSPKTEKEFRKAFYLMQECWKEFMTYSLERSVYLEEDERSLEITREELESRRKKHYIDKVKSF